MMVQPKRPCVFVHMRDGEWQREAIDRFPSPAHSLLGAAGSRELSGPAPALVSAMQRSESFNAANDGSGSAARGLDLWNYDTGDLTAI